MQNPFLLSCPTQTTASLWPPKMRCKCSHLLNSSCCLVTSESTVNTRCSLYDLNRPIHLSALPPVATLVRLSYHNWLLAVAFYLQYQTSELSFLTFSKTANVSEMSNYLSKYDSDSVHKHSFALLLSYIIYPILFLH